MELAGAAPVNRTNCGLYIRQEWEKNLRVELLDTNGQVVDTNVKEYS